METDLLGHRLYDTDTRWTLDLADHYRWQPIPEQEGGHHPSPAAPSYRGGIAHAPSRT